MIKNLFWQHYILLIHWIKLAAYTCSYLEIFLQVQPDLETHLAAPIITLLQEKKHCILTANRLIQLLAQDAAACRCFPRNSYTQKAEKKENPK